MHTRLQPYVPQARFLESACTKIDHANSCVYCQATLTPTLTLTQRALAANPNPDPDPDPNPNPNPYPYP